jgi:outer membrane protein OmpA-like peptidoglycan-associated protein
MKHSSGFDPEAFELDSEFEDSGEYSSAEDEYSQYEFQEEGSEEAQSSEDGFEAGQINPFIFESDFEDQEEPDLRETSGSSRRRSKTPARSARPAAARAAGASPSRCEVLDEFDFNKEAVTPKHRAQLTAIARQIVNSRKTRQPIRSVKLIGHTDAVGSERYNKDLGQRRAKQVETELRKIIDGMARGASGSVRFIIESRGESAPTGRGAAKDRRVQVCLPARRKTGCAPQKSRIRLHLKVLVRPRISIATMIRSMRQVFLPAGFRVEVASREILKLPVLENLDLRCPGTTTACCPFPCSTATLNREHVTLFRNRKGVKRNELAVYFVRTTTPPFNGCCAHPPGRPGVIVARGASRWSLAHEVAHVLGLSHVANSDRLMTGAGTSGITNPPPDLIASEIRTMERSALSIPC